MRFNSKSATYIFAIVLVFLPAWLFAQEVITNQEGRKVVMDANGKWHYYQEGDSILSDTLGPAYGLPKSAFDENQFRVAESKQLEKELAYALIRQRVQLVGIQIALLEKPENPAGRSQELYEQTERQIRKLEAEFRLATMRTAFLQQIAGLPEPIYSRKLDEWGKEHLILPKQVNSHSKKAAQTIRLTANAIAHGVLILPPKLPCRSGEVSVDPLTKEVRWQTAPSLIFSHTDAVLEAQFLKRDFIECAGSLTSLKGGVKMLNLEVAVTSSNAPEIFGVLPKNEFLELQLIDGKILRLFNDLPSNGQWVASQDAFVYRGSFVLGYREEKLLRRDELDKITLRWSKVQERYEVFETDFFIKQFQCLDALVSKEN